MHPLSVVRSCSETARPSEHPLRACPPNCMSAECVLKHEFCFKGQCCLRKAGLTKRPQFGWSPIGPCFINSSHRLQRPRRRPWLLWARVGLRLQVVQKHPCCPWCSHQSHGHRGLEMRLVEMKTCHKGKVHTGFQRLSRAKKQCKTSNNFLCRLHGEMMSAILKLISPFLLM